MPAVRMASSLIISSIALRSAGAVDDAGMRQPVERGEGEVVAHRHRQHQPFGLAVLRDQRHADPLASSRRADWRSTPACRRSAISPRDAAQHAEERQQQLALALAVEAAEPDHLARPDDERDVLQPVGPGQVAHLERPAACRPAPAAASAGRHGCIRGRSSSRRPRCRSWCRPRRSRRCGRCGTPCIRRRARRSRACGARCRGAPGPPRAAASAPRRPWSTSAAVSAEVASSRMRMRGLRASALAISTICRRDSGRSLTSASGWMSSPPARASASSAMRRCAARSIMPKRFGGLLMTMLSATERSGISDSSWKMQTMPASLAAAGDGEADLAAVERHAAFVGRDHAGHDLDQRRFAGAVLAEDGVDAARHGRSARPSPAPGRRHSAWRRPPCGRAAVPASILPTRLQSAAGLRPRRQADRRYLTLLVGFASAP